MKGKILVMGCVVSAACLSGCANKTPTDPNLIICTQRSPVCTQDYTPVCGQNEAGEWQTFANGCNACTNLDIVGYIDGKCIE